jgi:hypothetical protein
MFIFSRAVAQVDGRQLLTADRLPSTAIPGERYGTAEALPLSCLTFPALHCCSSPIRQHPLRYAAVVFIIPGLSDQRFISWRPRLKPGRHYLVASSVTWRLDG